nr:hypothetical protein [Mycoplasmopsis bovis]
MEKLLTHFDSSTAYKLYVIAILRCAYPKAVNRDLKFYYETSFMSELFKKVGLSESLLPDFFEKTGRAYSNIHNFMLDRINEFKGRVQIIDGTLKSYNSDEVTFSQWSRKGKVKGSKDFTLLYTCAYIPKSQFITDHTKEICWIRLFLRTFWKMCLALGNISCW